MKDSGVAWIGEIPNHWKTLRLKFASWLKGRIGWQGLKSDEYTDEGAYLITGTDFDKGRINWDTCAHITVERFNEDSDIHIQEGDLLITKDGTIGKVAIARDCPAMVSLNSGVMLIRNIRKQKYHDKYLYYILNSNQFLKWYELSQNGASTIKHLYQEQFYNFRFSYPPLPEQEAIAAYLDEKCAVIDDIIAEAKASIEEYKAWKASVIFEAVTKGLDPNAEMKDSGVEWIGEVPEDWKICKTLFGLSMPITDGPHTTPDLYDTGIPFISAEAVSSGNGKIDFSHMRGYISEDFYQECCQKYIPQKNDIYMIKSGATTGRVAIVDTDQRFTIWSPLAVFRANLKRLVPKYLFYYLQSPAYLGQVEIEWSYGTQQNIGMRVLEQLKICLPPLGEQAAIAAYLDEKCAAIDGVIAEKESLIAELETYKKSLIFETVTGKRRVC